MAPRGHPNSSAKSRPTASFAAESTGGAVTFTLSSPPCIPARPLDDARGCTLIASVTPSACVVMKGGRGLVSMVAQQCNTTTRARRWLALSPGTKIPL